MTIIKCGFENNVLKEVKVKRKFITITLNFNTVFLEK